MAVMATIALEGYKEEYEKAAERSIGRFNQFIKFAFVGGINTAVDFAVLNALIYFVGTGQDGRLFSAFKAISFVVALVNSYVLNKYWVFKSQAGRVEGPADQKASASREGVMFAGVSLIGFFLNVAVSSLFFHILVSHYGHEGLFANVGSIVGTLAVLMWNYAGYTFFVFGPSAQRA